MSVGQFNGPLFLVGMPRSGTKLLRALLNQHSRIEFPRIETEFFPYWVAHPEKFHGIGDRRRFEDFYRRCQRLPFFIQIAEKGIKVGPDEWFSACKAFTPAAVFDALMRCVLSFSPQDDRIWADKSPSQVGHVRLLAEQFPAARILHVVRDVRDYALSINKAWGKSILRAAQRWQDDVSKCCMAGQELGSSYKVVRYEDLLAAPERTLRDICTFLDITYQDKMLELDAAVENKGDAKGMTEVLTSNVGKYRHRMAPATILKVEKIACTTLRLLDYPCDYTGAPARIPRWQSGLLQLADGVNLVRATMSKRGLLGSFRFHKEYFRTSGNRIQ